MCPRSAAKLSSDDASRLFIALGTGAFLLTCSSFAVSLGGFLFTSEVTAKTWPEPVLAGVAVMAFLAVVAGCCLLVFRMLRGKFPKREVRAVSVAFAAFALPALGVGDILAVFPGGYADLLLGRPFFAVGAFVGTFGVTFILEFLLCAVTLWMTRRIVLVEQRQEPSSAGGPRP